MQIVVEDVWEVARLVPEDDPWTAAPAEAPGTVTAGWMEPTDTTVCVGPEAVAPELAAAPGLAACGVG